MDFALFLLLNAVLFIRPAEIVPTLAGLPIYNAAILGCIVASFGKILEQLSTRSLAERPITVFVLGVWATVILSNLVRLDLAGAWLQGLEFTKVVVYYLLLNAVLNAPGRFERFLSWLVALVVVMSVLALLHQRGTIQIPGLELIERREYDEASGKEVGAEVQLMSTGIYNDPNDFCMILVVGICVAIYRGLAPRAGIVRIAWIAPAILFGYALVLTRSRGGFLGLLAFVLTLLMARSGWRRAVLPAVVLLPGLLLLSGGRQTAISTGADTAQSRMLLWREGLIMFLSRPLTGIGAGRYGEDMV